MSVFTVPALTVSAVTLEKVSALATETLSRQQITMSLVILSGEDALISNPPWEYTLFSGELEVCLRDTGLCDFRSHDQPKDFRDTW
jgi:hypothetical protein